MDFYFAGLDLQYRMPEMGFPSCELKRTTSERYSCVFVLYFHFKDTCVFILCFCFKGTCVFVSCFHFKDIYFCFHFVFSLSDLV